MSAPTLPATRFDAAIGLQRAIDALREAGQAGIATEYHAACVNQARQAFDATGRACLVCGGPSDTDECDTCVIDHDDRMKRAEDQ